MCVGCGNIPEMYLCTVARVLHNANGICTEIELTIFGGGWSETQKHHWSSDFHRYQLTRMYVVLHAMLPKQPLLTSLPLLSCTYTYNGFETYAIWFYGKTWSLRKPCSQIVCRLQFSEYVWNVFDIFDERYICHTELIPIKLLHTQRRKKKINSETLNITKHVCYPWVNPFHHSIYWFIWGKMFHDGIAPIHRNWAMFTLCSCRIDPYLFYVCLCLVVFGFSDTIWAIATIYTYKTFHIRLEGVRI